MDKYQMECLQKMKKSFGDCFKNGFCTDDENCSTCKKRKYCDALMKICDDLDKAIDALVETDFNGES